MRNHAASGPCSEQGSSDDPEEFGGDNEDNDTVQQQAQFTVPPSRGGRGGQRTSEGTYPTSQSSGSKRKSTDEALPEGPTRRQRARGKARQQLENDERIIATGNEIARSIRSNQAGKDLANEQMTRCIDRMIELGIRGKQHEFVLLELDTRLSKRIWMTKVSDEEILQWVNDNCPQEDGSNAPNGRSGPNGNQGGSNAGGGYTRNGFQSGFHGGYQGGFQGGYQGGYPGHGGYQGPGGGYTAMLHNQNLMHNFYDPTINPSNYSYQQQPDNHD